MKGPHIRQKTMHVHQRPAFLKGPVSVQMQHLGVWSTLGWEVSLPMSKTARAHR